ncbi:MAG: HAD-IIB family hydrolase [Alphaproteobacteria bacterium]|nr:HAD-IIB family hydrolase [Alphaproteobacteria bacterium]
MRPLTELPAERCRHIQYVLTDIDDTLTDEGRLTARAYGALEALERAGFRVVPITGRPAGWCDHIARFWPVDAVVGENGALYFRYDRAARRMTRRFWKDEAERAADRERLARLRERILAEVPGAGIASDQPYREADLAVDFREDVAELPKAEVARIVALFEAAGAHAKVSSIHVNGWFGEYDKLAMTRILFREQYGLDLDAVRESVAFAGDSPNDQPMFGFFPVAVGVANVRHFVDELDTPPSYVTQSPGGAGFAELAAHLIAARGAPHQRSSAAR